MDDDHPGSEVHVGSLAQVCRALPTRHHDSLHGRDYETGFFKQPVDGPVAVTFAGIGGDGQADLVNHGGPDKAVLSYAMSNYAQWAKSHTSLVMGPGAFGENFSVMGLDETTVCVHDRWRIGTALVEISQPRQPCWKLEARFATRGLIAATNATGRTGWYHRVIEEGTVASGDVITLVERRVPQWPIALAYRTTMHVGEALDGARALCDVAGLALGWKAILNARLQRH